MQGDPADSHQSQAPYERFGAVGFLHRRNAGKNESFPGQIVEEAGNLGSKMDVHHGPRFHAKKADGLLFPIHVLGSQPGDVRLGTAEMPEQLVIHMPFGIALTGQNFLMFWTGDGSLFPKFDFRPEPLRDNRLRQPIHAEGKIVQAAEKNVGGNRAFGEGRQEMVRLGFNQFQAADEIKGPLLHGAFPARPRIASLGLGDGVHDGLPRPIHAVGVSGHQVGAGDLQVDGRLAERLVAGVANPVRGLGIPRLETVLFFQHPVFQEEDSGFASKHRIACFHSVSLPFA
ncbi:MAG: hypothetical protein WAO02_01800 [Verrucomicrobiia bacterium]